MTKLEQIQALALQGISRAGVEATIGHPLDAGELAQFRKAQTIRRLQRAARAQAPGKAAPKSVAERVRDYNARKNDLGEIPPVRHPRLKERCRYDLEAFGWYYCRSLLKHRASRAIKESLVDEVQNCILNGGQALKLYGRGAGKSTWIEYIAPVWAVLYGHRRFPVVIAATLKQAKKGLKTIKRLLARSSEIAADFPAIARPVKALEGISQRAAAQTYRGTPTDIEWGSDQIALPVLRDARGALLDRGCGAVIAATGIGGAIRGANEGGQRPDFLVIDDPQTKKAAHSPAMVQDIINYIRQDALSLAGHDATMSAFVTITPQCFGDVATELSSQSKYPEWSVTVQPFIKTPCADFSRLAAEFCEAYAADMAAHDYAKPLSTAWYRQNRHRFAGLETVDPEQYDHDRELDIVHHLLNLRAKLGETAFNAEIMMEVVDRASELSINPDLVAKALNGTPRGVLPPGTDQLVAFCDVNAKKGAGLSWACVAFGPGRVAAVVDYGRFPAAGQSLVPPGSTDLERNQLVAGGIHHIIHMLAQRRFVDHLGRRVALRALGFDRGWLPDVVHRTLYVNRQKSPLPFSLVAMRGFPWNKFGTRQSDILRRDSSGYVFATRSQYGEYIAQMSAYWREIMQSGFLELPLMPGSLSLFGNNAAEHFAFANEICAEKLQRKYPVFNGNKTTMAWDWVTTGPEHFCDCLSGAFALASWFRCYDPLSSTIDLAALGRVAAKAPAALDTAQLFDPRENPAILSNSLAVDRGEGTGVDLPIAADLPRRLQPANPVNPLRRPIGAPKRPGRAIKKSQIWWKK